MLQVAEKKSEKFKQHHHFKKGDTVEVDGQTYYVNGESEELEKLRKRSGAENYEYEFAKRKVNFVNSKYFDEDTDVAAQMRSWFDGKQPTESQVRNAMIWSYDQFGDYKIKSGGGSASDHVYSSSLT